ncbi:hypothetical protein J437_LFUL017066 [Ladona fulva]|uniref:CCHC-type domain-containing protein n=1 Tax=Ladona fulva TaxID=123851 RepID=A0A8K0KPC4_LADFU|nr:hypothetical protein J437_LFUL017066 [Ladona fulva]
MKPITEIGRRFASREYYADKVSKPAAPVKVKAGEEKRGYYKAHCFPKAEGGKNSNQGTVNKETDRSGRPDQGTGPKKGTITHWVVETSPEARKVLLQQGRYYFGYTSYRLKEYLVVTRCMKCMKYGHIAKHCKGNERRNKCGGSGHGKEECKATKVFCATTGPKSECSGKQEAYDAYQQALRKLIEGTDYGD